MQRRLGGINRKDPVAMEELVQMFIKSMKLSAGLNTRRIFEAWDAASGASRYTLRRFFRDGKLYITLNSSMVRNQLGFQKAALVDRINAILREDELFQKDDPQVKFVEELILK
ncbi:MAG: DUF721 domain-containing protein [Bacteroidales bacterium]|nr:DUF721 domain-containing protein [Bacteroidales bacterium]